jgi:UDP-N-acetylglucosamine acyltransferase
MPIHPTAIIDPRAEIDPSAEVGAYVVIEGPVRIGPETRISPFVAIAGTTHIGAHCQIYPHAAIGYAPQDLAYDDSETFCVVGEKTIVREGATIHRGTGSGSSTVVGKGCFLMANSHVAHNCRLGDHVVLANGVLLAGHVEVGDRAFLGGGAAVHQFARIGELVMIRGLGRIGMDVPPFFLAGENNCCFGVNVVGIRRAGFTSKEREEIRTGHRVLYRSGLTFIRAIDQLADLVETEAGRRLVEFLRRPSKRGIIPASRRRDGNTDSRLV